MNESEALRGMRVIHDRLMKRFGFTHEALWILCLSVRLSVSVTGR